MLTPRLRCILVIVSLGILVASCAKPQASQPPPRPGEWTQFRLNPRHNAVLPGTLRTSWRLETHGAFSSSPAISGTTLYIGNNSGALYAIDVRTGHPRWTFHMPAPLMSNPLVYKGLVIVGEGDQQYFFRGPNHRFTVGPGENALIALDAKSGRKRWSVPLPGSGMPTPAIVNGLVVAHNGGGHLIGVRPENGVEVYDVDVLSTAAMSAVTPLNDGNVALAGSLTDAVQSRDASSGRLVWATAFQGGAWGMSDCPPASDGELLFCNYTGSPPGLRETWRPRELAVEHAWAVEAKTGQLRWNVTLEKGIIVKWNQAGIPLVVGHTVFFGGSITPYMHALATETGMTRWTFRARGPVKGGIAEKNGILYFGDLSGYLWAVDVNTGKAIGSKNMHTPFNVASPVIDGKTLFIGTRSGAIIAIQLDEIQHSADGG